MIPKTIAIPKKVVLATKVDELRSANPKTKGLGALVTNEGADENDRVG